MTERTQDMGLPFRRPTRPSPPLDFVRELSMTSGFLYKSGSVSEPIAGRIDSTARTQ
jgi:hypothetical protein